MKRTLGKIFNAITFLCISLICVIGLGYGLKASGVTGENFVTKLLTKEGNTVAAEPARDKQIKELGDGRYQLSLSVTGDAIKKVGKANVLIVYDVSGSMESYYKADNGSYGSETSWGNTTYFRLYKKDGNNCVAVKDSDNYTGTLYDDSRCRNQDKYTGDRYLEYRSYATEKVVHDFASTLLAKNTANPDTVQMALVTFSGPGQTDSATTESNATLVQNWTNAASFANRFASDGVSSKLTYGGGTNWEAAMRKAYTTVQSARKNVPTFVVFVTDGAPTFRLEKVLTRYSGSGECKNANSGSGCTYYGHGTSTADDLVNYRNTIDEVKNITSYNNSTTSAVVPTSFYGIYAFGTEGDLLDDLVYAANNNGTDRTADKTYAEAIKTVDTANYYNASDTSVLEGAFEEILNKIEMAGIANVEVIDGTTSNVTTSTGIAHLLTIDENSFEYYKGGSKWEQAPKAKVVNGEVVWDLGDDVLENGVEYKVTFNVWPSQETLDIIADLKNGTRTYESLDSNIKKYLNENLTLETNTTARVKYADTRIDNTVREVGIDNPPAVKTNYYHLDVEKVWENSIDDKNANGMDLITLKVFRDTTEVDSIKMSPVLTGWSGSTYIAPGIISQNGNNVEILELGHDYTLAEPENLTYRWELTSEVVHPMIINGVVNKLVLDKTVTISEGNYLTKDGKEYYKIDGKVYRKGASNEALTATNSRRSYFELNKAVNGEEAPADAKFTYNVKITNSMANLEDEDVTDDDEIWFSVLSDPSDKTSLVKNLVTSATAEMENGEATGYYKVPSGTAFTVELQAGWNFRIINLPTQSTYEVEETTMPQGFVFESVSAPGTKEGKKVTGKILEANEGYIVNYTNKYVLTDVIVTKNWVDNSDQDGVRPEKINVQLYADGTAKGAPVEMTGDKDTWTYTFAKQDKYNADGSEIVYTADEVAVPANYEKTSDGKSLTITNKHEIAKADVTINKKWADNANQDVIRPQSIQLQLYANGEAYGDPVTLTGNMTGETWSYTFPKLDVNAGGKAINYTVDEVAVPTDYRKSVEGLTVTNTHTPATTEAKVLKIWDDNENQDGKRPTEITVTLSTGKEFKLNAGNKWTATEAGLPKYRNNNGTKEEIKYTWTEQATLPNDYVLTGNEVDKDDATLTKITNKRTLETTEATVKKVWNDDNNRDGIQPTELKVYLNGKEYKLNAQNEWTITVDGLQKNNNGQPITYTWTEESVAGYTSATDVQGTVTTFTNTHTPATKDVTISKEWRDNDNQDGIRPANAKLQLYANGSAYGDPVDVATSYTFKGLYEKANGQPIVYTVDEVTVPEGYSKTVDGLKIINTHTTAKTTVKVEKVWNDGHNQDGIQPGSITVRLMDGTKEVASKEITAKENWKWEFTGLEMNRGGKPIVYTVTEDAVAGYTTAITGDYKVGFTVTNNYTPAVISVSGAKTWVDADDQDGARPGSITIKLMNGEKEVETKRVTAEDGWKWSFTGLAQKENGVDIVYSIKELPVDGYETQVNGYNVTNTHKLETIDINGQKTWNDNNNQDGKRPEKIVVKVMNGETVVASQEVTAANEWKYSFPGLAKNANGKAIKYTVTEEAVAGYTVSNDGYNLINTHKPETVDFVTEKVWADEENNDRVRPESITIRLLADGTEVDHKTVTANDNWSAAFTDLDKYKGGKEIVYTVVEDAVEGYTAEVNGKVITNTHKLETRDITVNKVWNDKDDQDGKRPGSVTVNLLADGTKVGEAVLSDENEWKHTFEGLQKKNAGEAIVYTVVEEAVEGYTTEYDGFTVKNTYNPEKTTVTVVKEWSDAEDQDGIRPEMISVKLLADGVEKQTVEVKAEEGWTYTFSELDKYRDGGTEIVYTVEEVGTVEGYEGSVEGFKITNTHTPETTEVAGNVYWDDQDNKDEIRPETVEICVYGNGEKVDCTTVTPEDEKWTYKFEELPKKQDGEEIVYTVTENTIDGYEIKPDGYDFTNKHVPEEGEVLGEDEETTEGEGTENPETGDTILPYALLLLTSLGGISITAKKIVDRKE